jgi:glycosyltransferase involved in cell wall biosynthesis
MLAPGQVFPAWPSASVARVTQALIQGLMEAGHCVTVVAAARSRLECELIPVCEDGIFLPYDPGFRMMRIAEQRALEIVNAIKDRLDIVHGQGFDVGQFHSSRFLEPLDFPNVTTCHSCIDICNLDYFLACRNNLIAISNNQREACPRANFVATVYNGLDPSSFPIVTDPEDYLCFLGRMERYKQPHLAMQLAIQIKMKLKVAGRIDESDPTHYFDNYCREYLNNPLIEYLGELGMDDKIRLLSRARCNLHPTGFREPFGLTVIEAGYCGTPTLAIRRGALPELIDDGRTGVLVEDFAEGFFKLPQCLKMDRSYIAQRTREQFNYKRMTADYLRVYYTVIHQFRSERA